MIDLVEGLRLAVDTGVLTLIWLVQLVIYPGLTRYAASNLKSWHSIYTRRVTYVVLPLMLIQLGISCYQVLFVHSISDILHLCFIAIAWVITFIKAVPLHQAIDVSTDGNKIAYQLIKVNKTRTVMWTAAWLLSVIVIFI